MDKEDYLIGRFNEAAGILPQNLRRELTRISDEEKVLAEEFRLRAGKSATVVLPDGEKPVGKPVSRYELNSIVEVATEASMHSSKESLKSGYVTASGGHRIGICGTAVVKNGEVTGFRSISSLNIRISKEIIGIGKELINEISNKGQVCSTLIISPPGGGKTTLLRDLIRLISNDGTRVAIADERGEIAALKTGVPQFDVGLHTDVMEFCPRAEAVNFLLRAMNPQVIAMDEITNPEEFEALKSAFGCGVKLIATAHSGSIIELVKRKIYREIMSCGLFDRIVIIGKKNSKRYYSVERSESICLKQ